MTIAEKVNSSGLDFDVLLAEYRNVRDQTDSKKEAADYIFWLSEGWDGDKTFTLPELTAALEREA